MHVRDSGSFHKLEHGKHTTKTAFMLPKWHDVNMFRLPSMHANKAFGKNS